MCLTFFSYELTQEDETEINSIKKKYGSVQNYISTKCKEVGNRDKADKLKKDPKAIVWNKKTLSKILQ